VRYVFDTDPLAFGYANRAQNLYYLTRDSRHIISEQHYYVRDEVEERTARDLLDAGISVATA
jgi:hypothetical protein